MKTETTRRALTGFAALCYLVFLSLDFLRPATWEISSAIKYAGLLACATIAVTGDDAPLRAALLLTAMCDYLLLFTRSHLPAVLAFACAQALHAFRNARLAKFPAKFSAYPAAALALAAGAALYLAARDALLAACAAYAILLLAATAFAAAALARGTCERRRATFTAGGMSLFVLCDACVAAYNLGVSGAGTWMWAFYLPSQWLLASSSVARKIPGPSVWTRAPVRRGNARIRAKGETREFDP